MQMDELKLKIELVPKGQWGANLRKALPTKQWDLLRRRTYKAAGYRCEICDGVGRKHPVECHEIWHYDDANLVQTLEGLIALCPPCHGVKHMGRSLVIGHGPRAIAHFMQVNELDEKLAEFQIAFAFTVWEDRSKDKWALDLSWLDENG